MRTSSSRRRRSSERSSSGRNSRSALPFVSRPFFDTTRVCVRVRRVRASQCQRALYFKQNDAQKKEDDAKLAEVEKFIKSENAVALPLPEKGTRTHHRTTRTPSHTTAHTTARHDTTRHDTRHDTRHAYILRSALERNRQTDRTEEEELKARVREHAKNLRAYWVPGKAPSAEESLLPKPSSKTHDPMSNDPVRLKDLLPIEFTPVQNVNVREADKIGRWMCPVCFTILSNRYPHHRTRTPRTAHLCHLNVRQHTRATFTRY